MLVHWLGSGAAVTVVSVQSGPTAKVWPVSTQPDVRPSFEPWISSDRLVPAASSSPRARMVILALVKSVGNLPPVKRLAPETSRTDSPEGP